MRLRNAARDLLDACEGWWYTALRMRSASRTDSYRIAAVCDARDRQGERRCRMTKHLSPSELRQFTGSEHWYRHGLVRTVVFTDGAKYVADQAGAYWLLDTIALSQRFEKRVAAEAFQVWKLAVKPDRTATLTCDDGNGITVFEQRLDYTDFPVDGITLYFTDNTILLPSEY